MSLLSIVINHCQVHNLTVPGAVVSNQDTTIRQIFGIMNQLMMSIQDESNFQGYTKEALRVLTAAEDQGAMTAIADGGYLWAHNGTFFNRTLKRALIGPVTDVEWQALKALPTSGTLYKYRIRGGRLLINPIPSTPFSQIAFEYASSYGVITASTGLADKALFTADNDDTILPQNIIQAGLAYRWKEVKGFPAQAEKDRYYSLLNNYIARDGTKRIIDTSQCGAKDIRPGIFVPAGSWDI